MVQSTGEGERERERQREGERERERERKRESKRERDNKKLWKLVHQSAIDQTESRTADCTLRIR
jgi:hypothetical protein